MINSSLFFCLYTTSSHINANTSATICHLRYAIDEGAAEPGQPLNLCIWRAVRLFWIKLTFTWTCERSLRNFRIKLLTFYIIWLGMRCCFFIRLSLQCVWAWYIFFIYCVCEMKWKTWMNSLKLRCDASMHNAFLRYV